MTSRDQFEKAYAEDNGMQNHKQGWCAMSEVKRYWSHPNDAGAQIEMVSFSDYDALAQQLAASEARVSELIEDRARFPDRPDSIGDMIGSHIRNLKHRADKAEDDLRWRYMEILGLQNQLAARDKQLADAVGLLKLAEPFLAHFVSSNFFGANAKKDLERLRTFLTTIEQDKENE